MPDTDSDSEEDSDCDDLYESVHHKQAKEERGRWFFPWLKQVGFVCPYVYLPVVCSSGPPLLPARICMTPDCVRCRLVSKRRHKKKTSAW